MAWFDASKVDFDPPVVRSALVYWRASEARWIVHKVTRVRAERDSLLDLGELLFGEQPWSQVVVLDVYGRLGSVEAAVAALALAGPLVLKVRLARVEPELDDLPLSSARKRKVRSDAGRPRQSSLL